MLLEIMPREGCDRLLLPIRKYLKGPRKVLEDLGNLLVFSRSLILPVMIVLKPYAELLTLESV